MMNVFRTDILCHTWHGIKRAVGLVSLLIFTITAVAQDITISGTVYDGEKDVPLPFSTVTVSDASTGKLVTGSICDEDGFFSIRGDLQGDYIVNISFLGYQEKQIGLIIGELNNHFDLGKISMVMAWETIEEITITGTASQVSQDLDKKTFEMDEIISQSGGSVLDAMKTLPGVTIDQDGKVILRGSDKVVVLIDGKQSSLTGFGNQKGLGNIPAANIESIEIINNPSAKYMASGMAGIINITYKKEDQKGFNGDLGFSYGIGALQKAREDLATELGSFGPNSKYIPSVNLNYRQEKYNVFLLAESMFLHHLPNNEFTTRYYDDGRITASQVPENRTQKHYILNGGMEYYFNERNTLVISGIYDWERHVDTAQVPYIDMLTGNRYRYINWSEDETTGYMNYIADYTHLFLQPGHQIVSSVQYTRGWEDETYYINDSSEFRTGGRDVTNILAVEHTGSVQTDYTKPLREGRFEAGAKVQVRRLPVDYTVVPGIQSIIYPGMGAWSDWGENLYALYSNYVLEKRQLDIEAGLRAEYTGITYEMDPDNIYYEENDAYKYFDLFPNFRFSIKPGSNHRLSAFYNRRIDRPGEPELRIFAKSDDHELLKVGNPYLRPQFTNSFELAYRFKWSSGLFYISAYHRIINDPYMRIYTADTTNAEYDVIVKIYANTGNALNTGTELVFSQQLIKFWKLSGNANFYRNAISAYTGDLRFPYPHNFSIPASEEFTWDAKLNNHLNLGDRLEIDLTLLYLAPKNIPQGRQLARTSLDLGISWKFNQGKGIFTVSANDILDTYGIRQEISNDGFNVVYENYYETQVIRAGLKYRL